MLPEPTVEFNLDPPTYEQATNVIRKMKTSGSPCPLDQLSIIVSSDAAMPVPENLSY